MTEKRQNIIFSTTRQWNPGDEIILKGVLRVFNSLGIKYNPIIYNRNPDLQSPMPALFRKTKIEADLTQNNDMWFLQSNLHIGMFDNSVKPDMDASFADWVVFSGTPEWTNGRMHDLYHLILKYDLPVMILGVGGGLDCYDQLVLEVISKAVVLTTRDQSTLNAVLKQKLDYVFNPQYLPCPSLLSADPEKEKEILEVKHIGLIYQARLEESVVMSGCSEKLYNLEMKLFNTIIERYKYKYEISVICHYIDEIPLAIRDFPNIEVIYSYNSDDYFDLYHRFDIVIGSRVHGIGTAASMLIPGLALVHDARGETCKGFLAPAVSVLEDGYSVDNCLKLFNDLIDNIRLYNSSLKKWKEATMKRYLEIVQDGLERKTAPEYANHLSDKYKYYNCDLVNLSKKINEFKAFCGIIIENIYFDTGEGFIEESHIEVTTEIKDSILMISVPLPDGTQSVRFDPVEGMYCVIKEFKVSAGEIMLPIKSHNGIDFEEFIIFNTQDPQLIFDVPEKTSLISTTISVLLLSKDEMSQMLKMVRLLHQKVEEINACVKRTEDFKTQATEWKTRAEKHEISAYEQGQRANEAEKQANDWKYRAELRQRQAEENEHNAIEQGLKANEAEARANEWKQCAEEQKARADKAEEELEKLYASSAYKVGRVMTFTPRRPKE